MNDTSAPPAAPPGAVPRNVAGAIPRPAALLVALWVVVVLLPAPFRELMPPDESRFAHQAQNMKESGDFIVPRIGDVPNAEKPPALFWLIDIASAPLARVTETSARLPIALASLIVVLLTLRLGARLTGSRDVGAIAGAILLTGAGFAASAQWIACDMPLAAFALITTTLWREALFERPARRGGIALGWISAALGTLTKGPVAVLWPVFWIVAEAAARRNWRPIRRLASVAGLIAYVAVASSWILALVVGGHGDLARHMVVNEGVTRFVKPPNPGEPPWFYFWQLPLDWLPWAVFFPAAGIFATRAWRSGDERRRVAARAAVLFCGIMFFFFTLSTGKRGVYLLPAGPAIALLVAGVFVPRTDNGLPPAWRRIPLLAIAALGAVVGIAAPLLIATGRAPSAAPLIARTGVSATVTLASGGLALLVGGLAAWWFDRRRGLIPCAATLVVALAVVWLSLGTVGAVARNRFQNAAAFGARIDRALPPGAHLYVERGKFELVLFYARRHGEELQTTAEFLDRLRSPGPHYAVLTARRWVEVKRASEAAALQPLFSAPVANTAFVVVGPPANETGAPAP